MLVTNMVQILEFVDDFDIVGRSHSDLILLLFALIALIELRARIYPLVQSPITFQKLK